MDISHQNSYHTDQKPHQLKNSSTDLSSQVSSDILEKLKSFKNQKIGIKVLSRLIGVHEKTLVRLANQENKPGHQTLIRIYRYLLSSNDDKDLLTKTPLVVREALKNKFKHLKNIELNRNDNYINIQNEIAANPVFTHIYFYLATGGITLEKIRFKFGSYGEEILSNMLLNQIAVCLNKNGLNILGPNQPNFNDDTIKIIGKSLLNLLKKHKADEIGNHFQSFHIEGLNENSYDQWLKIDIDAYEKKRLIAENEDNHGTIRAFTYNITETLK